MVNTQNRTKSEDTSWWGGEEQGITLQLINLPITTTIKLHIHHVDMEISGFDSFRIIYAGQPANQNNPRLLPIDFFSS